MEVCYPERVTIPDNVVTYDEAGRLSSALVEFEAKDPKNPKFPILSIPVMAVASYKAQGEAISYADMAKARLIYKLIIRPYMTEYSIIYTKKMWVLDMEHVIKYHGYVFKGGL